MYTKGHMYVWQEPKSTIIDWCMQRYVLLAAIMPVIILIGVAWCAHSLARTNCTLYYPPPPISMGVDHLVRWATQPQADCGLYPSPHLGDVVRLDLTYIPPSTYNLSAKHRHSTDPATLQGFETAFAHLKGIQQSTLGNRGCFLTTEDATLTFVPRSGRQRTFHVMVGCLRVGNYWILSPRLLDLVRVRASFSR